MAVGEVRRARSRPPTERNEEHRPGYLELVEEIVTTRANESNEVAPTADAAALTLEQMKKQAYERLRSAELAWYAYFTACEVGPERFWAADVYERLRCATRRDVDPLFPS